MQVTLIAHTPEPEKVVAAAYKVCYSGEALNTLLEDLSVEQSRAFVRKLADLHHDSPTEHAVFTFSIEGVSRSLMAQITRHRMATFSVRSQRYVRMDDFEYVVPPEMAALPEAQALFEDAMQKQAETYEELAQKLAQSHKKALLQQGLGEKEAQAKAQKQAIEDARFVLPNACATQMLVTMNARSLNNFFRLRCCARAQWEIRAVANEMLRLVCGVAPALFEKAGPGCVAGACPEGKMSCGAAAEMRGKYAQMKEAAAHG